MFENTSRSIHLKHYVNNINITRHLVLANNKVSQIDLKYHVTSTQPTNWLSQIGQTYPEACDKPED